VDTGSLPAQLPGNVHRPEKLVYCVDHGLLQWLGMGLDERIFTRSPEVKTAYPPREKKVLLAPRRAHSRLTRGKSSVTLSGMNKPTLKTKTQASLWFRSAPGAKDGTVALARALGVTPQAIYQWDERLTQERVDRIVGAAVRLGMLPGLLESGRAASQDPPARSRNAASID
jgi:hypothetical protein